MQKLLTTIIFFLMSLPVLAATKEMEGGTPAPVETVGMVYIVIFGVIFIGMIIGFFAYLFMSDKDKKPEQK